MLPDRETVLCEMPEKRIGCRIREKAVSRLAAAVEDFRLGYHETGSLSPVFVLASHPVIHVRMVPVFVLMLLQGMADDSCQ